VLETIGILSSKRDLKLIQAISDRSAIAEMSSAQTSDGPI